MKWNKITLLTALVVFYVTTWALAGTDPSISGPAVVRSGNLAVFKIEHFTKDTTITYLPRGSARYFHQCGNEIIFARRAEGTVKIVVLEDRVDDVYFYKFIFKNSADGPLPPDPGPDPDPGPEPDPEPDPTPGPRQLMVIMESSDLDNLPRPQQVILNSQTLRAELAKAGHVLLGVLDKDSTGADGVVPDKYKAWYEAAKGKTLPVLMVCPKAGGTIEVVPLPANEAALWDILGGKP